MPHPVQLSSPRLRWRDYRSTVLFLLLMLVFRSSWADWVRVPTGSMNPTIVEGDRILVDKHAYGVRLPFTHWRLSDGSAPKRGDIVVFDSPVDGQSLVKRVVGLPGDLVSLDGERLRVNGVTSSYTPGDPSQLVDLPQPTLAEDPQVMRERGAAGEHDVLLLPRRAGRAPFATVRVPPGQYLMLGDNRDNSADSRYFGFVPRANLVGRASHVVVSLNPERYYLPRADRFLTSLY